MVNISDYLISNEKILQTWKDGSKNIHATNKRIIVENGQRLLDATYPHISSIEYEKKRRTGRLVFGIFLLIFGIFIIPGGWAPGGNAFFLGFGFLFFILGIVLIATSKSSKIKMHIVGREPIELSAKMESVLRWVRDYKTRIET